MYTASSSSDPCIAHPANIRRQCRPALPLPGLTLLYPALSSFTLPHPGLPSIPLLYLTCPALPCIASLFLGPLSCPKLPPPSFAFHPYSLMLRAAVLLLRVSTADLPLPPPPPRAPPTSWATLVLVRFKERRFARQDSRATPAPEIFVPRRVSVVSPERDATASMLSSSTLI